jgi:hypothetical protein
VDLLQTIFSNNRLVLDAVEQAEPVLRRLAGRVGECLRAGGHIVLNGGKSPVIGEYASETDLYAVLSVPIYPGMTVGKSTEHYYAIILFKHIGNKIRLT